MTHSLTPSCAEDASFL